jgi:uncharacterized protein
MITLHLLSAGQASALNQELRNFDNRTTIEVAVVTVNSIGSETPQDYAVNIGNYWSVGKRAKNNGILFLVAMDSHGVWIVVGPGLAGRLGNTQIQQVVDTVIIPKFRSGQPDEGIIEGARSIIRHFDKINASLSISAKEIALMEKNKGNSNNINSNNI